MRISADHLDPGHANYDRAKDYTITLDGAVQTDVITADESLGYILRIKRPLATAGIGDVLQTEALIGTVVITCG